MKTIFKFILVIIMLVLLSGCNDYHEVNDYAMVSGLSIDLVDNKYEVGIQIMNAKKEKESDSSLITFYKESGNTIYEALEKIMLSSPKELYLGHTEIIVISEDLLKQKDPLDYMDYFMRDPEMQKNSLVAISKEKKASDILKVITPLETIPSTNLKSTLSVADNFSGTLTIITLDEFISDLLNDGVDAVLPSIFIKGNVKEGEKTENINESDPNTKLVYDTLGFFENKKLKGYLTEDESLGYTFLANVPKETYIFVPCDNNGNYATSRVSKIDFKETFEFKNKKPIVNINITSYMNLLEYNCKADFIKDKSKTDKLQKDIKDKIKKEIERTINRLYVENKSDALKYGLKFYQKQYKEMKKLGYTKDSIKYDLKFNIKTDCILQTTELSIKSIKEDNDE